MLSHVLSSFGLVAVLCLLFSVVSPASAQPGGNEWVQQGGNSFNQGFNGNAQFVGTNGVSIKYQVTIPDSECQTSLISSYSDAAYFLCYNNDASGNFNVTVYAAQMSTGSLLSATTLQPIPSYASTLATPALYGTQSLVIQTNTILYVFSLDQTGALAPSPKTITLNATTTLGTSITIDQGSGVVYMTGNYNLLAYDLTTASQEPLWVYTYTNIPFLATCGYSGLSLSGDSSMILFTFTCANAGSEVMALYTKNGKVAWQKYYAPVGASDTTASTPVINNDYAYIALNPLGLVVLEVAEGTILTNGSYTLSQATGMTPVIYFDKEAAEPTIIYECQVADGYSTTYQLCATDIKGNLLNLWSNPPTTRCKNTTGMTSYSLASQPIVTANGIIITSMASSYDSLSCMQGFDLGSGNQVFSFQQSPIATDQLFGSVLIDQNGIIYTVASSNDFVSSFVALQPATAKKARHHAHSQKKMPPKALTPPVWPEGFNATLVKIGPDSFPNDIQWTKLYFSGPSSRFDFYTSYIGLDQQWHCNFTILFTPVVYQGTTYPMIYHIYPDGGPGPLKQAKKGASTATCYIRANNIPNISRNWLSNFSFMSFQQLRGVPVQWWQLPTDNSLNYFNKYTDDYLTPVRSTNQANDPGATDYSDYMEGDQDQNLFEVPDYCPPPVSKHSGAGVQTASKADMEWINLLPQPFQHHVRSQVLARSLVEEL